MTCPVQPNDVVIDHDQPTSAPDAERLNLPVHRLGAANYACAVPGINLNDYSTTPEQRGWGPHCSGPFSVVSLSSGAKVTVDARVAGLVSLIMEANIRQGYSYRAADTGAYNCRYIAGTTVWSNHAWGLAIDSNWGTNPQHSPLITDRPAWELQRWARYGFAWGGFYNSPTTPDAMHTEFQGTPAQAAAALALAQAELGGGPPPPAGTWPDPQRSPITGNLEHAGFDASYSRPAAQPMVSSGYQFVIGYVSNTPAKNLQASDANAYRAAGLAVGLVCENSAQAVLGGASAGAADGAMAEAQANALGYPVDSVIFFAVDFDIQPGDYPALNAYANAFNSATQRPVGVYASGAVLDALVTPGAQPVRYGWQAMSTGWSGSSSPSAHAHLLQRYNHPAWPVPAGVSASAFDEDVALQFLPLWGWQGSPPPPPPPPPPPAPTHPSVLAWNLPAGNYYGNIAGPAASHGGYYASEQPFVKNIQQWLVYHGCTPVAASSWATTTWADGKWQGETDTAMTLWHSRFYPGQPHPAQCWSDDYRRLAVG